MTTSSNPAQTHRARTILEAVGRAYPGVWTAADRLRAWRGVDLPDWPDWCYLPLHGAYALVSGGGANRVPLARGHHIGIVGALAAWRMTQGIYRFDPALYPALVDTAPGSDLPHAALYRLPEWCVYVETPDRIWLDRRLHGAWAHLDWSENAADELRLVLDTANDPANPLDPERGLVPLPIPLGADTLGAALVQMAESGARQAAALGYQSADPRLFDGERMAASLWPLLSLVLYLCADDAELGDGARRPQYPIPTKTKRGPRLFPPPAPTTWDVGVRLGAALRRAYQTAETEPPAHDGAGHTRPRPHIRRAHFHGFWTGPRAGPQRLSVRWLPPIPVNVRDVEALPATIHPVPPDEDAPDA